MNPDSVTAWLYDFSRRHDLPHINPHAFRHTVASVLLANGTDIVAQLGHASASTTENFYAHIIEENKAKASECIADVLLRNLNSTRIIIYAFPGRSHIQGFKDSSLELGQGA